MFFAREATSNARMALCRAFLEDHGHVFPESEDLEIHTSETHGSWVRFYINRRLYGLSSRYLEIGWTSSWNPEAGWNLVLEPGGWMDSRPGTWGCRVNPFFKPVDRYHIPPPFVSGPEAVYNLEVFYEPGGHFWTRRTQWSFGNPKVPSDPEVVFRTRRSFGNPEVPLDSKVILNPEALRSFQDPKTSWGPKGTVLHLPRQDYSRYLFEFRILPLGSWPLSSSYDLLDIGEIIGKAKMHAAEAYSHALLAAQTASFFSSLTQTVSTSLDAGEKRPRREAVREGLARGKQDLLREEERIRLEAQVEAKNECRKKKREEESRMRDDKRKQKMDKNTKPKDKDKGKGKKCFQNQPAQLYYMCPYAHTLYFGHIDISVDISCTCCYIEETHVSLS
ncbi:hypothetical protein F2Q69_00014511 [Brassica cretica]|uniref:Uncharacterized protein n=1 Tax=Brassica cretica TaxID=69181 RepID=A0A8S9R616_BRACR|nr:hypothetical protein F2Q69_00014511 [Brassica cretica]